MKPRLIPLLISACLACASTGAAQSNPDWTRAFPPFRIIGNIYWVGSYDLASYLIVTPQGHILINTGVGDTAKQIKASVEQLGFKLADTKILTATHGHFDHVAGFAELKRMTGARLIVSEPDKELFESGGKADFRFGDAPEARFEPVKVDGTFKDNDTISLGGTTLTTHHHPGHTKGATSFTLNVQESGKTYRVVIANMGSINPGVTVSGMPKYPGIAADYARTFKAERHGDRRLAGVARLAVQAAREVQARRRVQSRPVRRSAGVQGGGRTARENVSGTTGKRARPQVIASLARLIDRRDPAAGATVEFCWPWPEHVDSTTVPACTTLNAAAWRRQA